MLLPFLILLHEVSSIKINPSTRMFVDDYGRTVLFHGVNIVVKQPPYLPITSYFDPQMSVSASDISNLTNWGFNFVRLGVMWESVESLPETYNMTYLGLVNDLINALGQSNIYTLVDAHQDAYARHICGEGIPDFYAANLTDNCTGLFGKLFEKTGNCKPFSSYHYPVDSQGNPEISACLNKSFVDYFKTPEAADGYQRIYENIYGMQDRFAAFWNVTSSFFASNPYVLGYDMLNEPLQANAVTQPWVSIPGVNDLVNLQPLYKRIHSVIRENDQNKTLFFEPIQADLIPHFGGMVFPIGFNDTPGGVAYNDRQILNDHSYCCQGGAEICAKGEPSSEYASFCKQFNMARVVSRKVDAEALNVGLIISEFGACFDTQDCVNEITSVTEACDANLAGWGYWMFKGFGDFTTTGNLQEGFYNNQTLQVGKVKALARTYPQYTQGTPTFMNFDSVSGDFVLEFVLSESCYMPTVLFASTEFYYPNGVILNVTSEPKLNFSVSNTTHNYWEILFPNPIATNVTVTLKAV